MSEVDPELVLFVIGLIAVIGAALNWRIVSHSGKLLNRLFGDTAARAVYASVGVVLIVLGIFQFLGVQ